MSNTAPRTFHYALSMAFFLATWMSMAVPAAAQTPDNKLDVMGNQVENYLIDHPKEAEQLHGNPALINNPQWLAQHPEVQHFVNSHPGFQKAAAENPKWIVNHSDSLALHHAQTALNKTDEYMKQHPELAKQLSANPRLIDDPQFLAQHPGLDHELASHPEIREAAMKNPGMFKKYAEYNNNYNNEHHHASGAKGPKAKPAPKPATRP